MGSTNYLRRENLVNLIPQTSTNSRVNFYLSDDASLCNRATLTELAIDQPIEFLIHDVAKKRRDR